MSTELGLEVFNQIGHESQQAHAEMRQPHTITLLPHDWDSLRWLMSQTGTNWPVTCTAMTVMGAPVRLAYPEPQGAGR